MTRRTFHYKVILLLMLAIVSVFPLFDFRTFSNDVDELQKQLIETEEQKAIKQKILKETEAEVNSILNSSWSISQKIAALEDQIKGTEENIALVKEDIKEKEAAIEEQEGLINEKMHQMEEISKRLYINSRINLLDLLLGTEVANDIVRSYVLKKYTFNKQVQDIEVINFELSGLANKKLQLDNQKVVLEAEEMALAESKEVLDQQRSQLEEQLVAQNLAKGTLQKEITLLNNKITQLQEAILVARSGAFVPSIGSVPMADDFNGSAEGFRSNAPSGSFAVFSMGAYTHRAGMSQYGAQGRAKSGQNANQIINAYYKKTPMSVDTSGTIKVKGYGEMDFETTYLYGIAEMYSHWHIEAQKAQAIIARSYAYNNFKKVGAEIGTTQANQVFLKSKSDNPPLPWKEAVDSTRGLIIDHRYIYYSASTGGYFLYKKDAATPWTGFWDTTDGTAGGDWTAKSYESIAGSPWLYKSWYRLLPHLTGIYVNPNDCGRGNPWLTEAEMVDLLNTWLVMKRNGVVKTVEDSRIVPITINSCSYGSWTGNPYSHSEMRSLLQNPVTNIYGFPDVRISNNGQTESVSFSTNRGVITISGMEFKGVYNTRAPAYLSIPQSANWTVDFAFFNIERKP